MIPLVALAILAAAFLWQVQSLYSSMRWVDHTDQVIGSAQLMMKLIVDMETGVRGYLNTGKTNSFSPTTKLNLPIDRTSMLSISSSPINLPSRPGSCPCAAALTNGGFIRTA